MRRSYSVVGCLRDTKGTCQKDSWDTVDCEREEGIHRVPRPSEDYDGTKDI